MFFLLAKLIFFNYWGGVTPPTPPGRDTPDDINEDTVGYFLNYSKFFKVLDYEIASLKLYD